MEPLISVIVPVYKAEQYLDECVQSIRNQTYTNLEIILVDDGSPDRCPEMCDEYAKQDSRIKVIHKKNGGPSSARNIGLNAASGLYIGFVDSDDVIAPNMYERLLFGISGGNDIWAVKCKIKRIIDGTLYTSNFGKNTCEMVITPEDFLLKLVTDYFSSSVCDMLFDRRIFDNLMFEEGKKDEDLLFLYNCGYYVEKQKLSLRLINEELYYYRVTNDSICTSQSTPFLISVIENCQFMYYDAKKKNDNKLTECLYVKFAAAIFTFILQMSKHPIWRKQYFNVYHSKLFEFDRTLFRKYWGVRHRVGFIIAMYVPSLLQFLPIFKFITKKGICPPCELLKYDDLLLRSYG